MAFSYLSETGFEQGDKGHFDVETDTESRLDVIHYSAMALVPGYPVPFRGAYCARVQLANDGTPADAYFQETGSWDLAATGSIFFRLAFYVTPDIVMANNDEFAILQLWSGASTAEGGAYINYTTANGLRLGIGETSASSFRPLTTGVWHQLELKFVIDAGGGNDGTIDAWLDGYALTQVASLDQAAITSGVVGVVGQDAGTTTGNIFFDEIVADDTRIGPIIDQYPNEVVLTASGHVFVGRGDVENVALQAGAGTDCVVTLYDTDTAYTTDASMARVELKNTANSELVDPAGVPIHFHRGCYAVLAGTTPRATVKVCKVQNYSRGAIRSYGKRRKAHPIMG